MRSKFLAIIISLFFVLISSQTLLAEEACVQPRIGCAANPSGIPGVNCRGTKDETTGQCVIADPDNDCAACPSVIPPSQTDPFGDVFGKIKLPDALKNLVGGKPDPTGAEGLSQFFSNLIALFYSIAAVVLVFMLIWGAWDWLTSGGEKEKIEAARNKIINAIIGIILFAVAFAIIQILGQLTGFTFFTPNTPNSK